MRASLIVLKQRQNRGGMKLQAIHDHTILRTKINNIYTNQEACQKFCHQTVKDLQRSADILWGWERGTALTTICRLLELRWSIFQRVYFYLVCGLWFLLCVDTNLWRGKHINCRHITFCHLWRALSLSRGQDKALFLFSNSKVTARTPPQPTRIGGEKQGHPMVLT